MRYDRIQSFAELNDIDSAKVAKLAESMLAHGWVGCPILIVGESLLTGSHRLAALKVIAEQHPEAAVLDQAVAEDVTEIVEAKLAEFEAENGYIPEIEYDCIGWLLEGSWIEAYKDEIAEW